jgi:hypothetical protein
MAAIYSNGGNRWNILGFNFTKRDALSSVYKISMPNTDTLLWPLQCSFKEIQLTSELVMIYGKKWELGVSQISCSFSQDLEVILIIMSNSITYCALKQLKICCSTLGHSI